MKFKDENGGEWECFTGHYDDVKPEDWRLIRKRKPKPMPEPLMGFRVLVGRTTWAIVGCRCIRSEEFLLWAGEGKSYWESADRFEAMIGYNNESLWNKDND